MHQKQPPAKIAVATGPAWGGQWFRFGHLGMGSERDDGDECGQLDKKGYFHVRSAGKGAPWTTKASATPLLQ